ncbi:phage tail protein [Pseudomonas sp. S07E 245]|uniref:phage tail protein n=1 Tax=Pseudomonas sp. S07E 245 TaxID=2866278 RepID=UPI001C735643|nr:phage tail protein [Pseudomonas sp. S07E 245]QYX54537.1 phage tail protein [Pseudomonas sp. S07E 245]
MPWYRVGTVAITAGQTTVTGTGTNFSANGRVGDAFLGPDGRWYEVTNIPSGTVLSILPAYQGATVSGGTYALAPMQGYVKESADRLRQLVDQFGATLAGLGAVSTENVVPVAKGGTGGTTPALARAGLQLGTAAVAAILGTVSQAGGTPTGAIMEMGSNANGHYAKFACGFMICWGTGTYTGGVATSANSSTFISPGGAAITWPVAFAGSAPVELSGGVTEGSYRVICVPYRANALNGTLTFQMYISSTADVVFSWKAVGRWF